MGKTNLGYAKMIHQEKINKEISYGYMHMDRLTPEEIEIWSFINYYDKLIRKTQHRSYSNSVDITSDWRNSKEVAWRYLYKCKDDYNIASDAVIKWYRKRYNKEPTESEVSSLLKENGYEDPQVLYKNEWISRKPKKPKEASRYEMFRKALEFCKENNFDPYLFIEAQFLSRITTLPYVPINQYYGDVSGKRSIAAYRQYIKEQKESATNKRSGNFESVEDQKEFYKNFVPKPRFNPEYIKSKEYMNPNDPQIRRPVLFK